MKTVILAEKPDQALKYAKALGSVKKNKGYHLVDTDVLQGEIIITWGVGHLVNLSPMQAYGEKYKRFDLKNLPFLPEKMIYEVSANTKGQFSSAKKQLESADLIIIATDPDREGENIAHAIFSKCSKKVINTPKKRLWINSMTDKKIKEGFQNLKDSKETYNFYKEAQTRQISDYLVGMNFTQYFTLFAQSKGLKGLYSLGRVQTPCNSLVVENDNEIKNFKEELFYRLFGEVTKNGIQVKFSNDIKFNSIDELHAAIKRYSFDKKINTVIESVEKEKKRKKAPKLFSLGGIQKYANAKWKYSLDKTLKTIQGLYQNGYLSYPRTDSDLITTNEFGEIRSYLDKYKNMLGLTFENVNLEPRKEYVNDGKVLEHYAIIPTDKLPDLDSLKADERNIYEAVVKNTVLMFAPDYEFETTVIKINIDGFILKASGNVPLKLGWTNIEKPEEEKEDEVLLPDFIKGEKIILDPKNEKGKTKPPKRLTESSLGARGGLMDKLGLGTPATRSSIIQTLINREYVRVEKTKLYPTEKGLLLHEMTKGILLGKPEMTATWEKYLEKIGKGEGKQEVFLDKINLFIDKTLNDLKELNIDSKQISNVKTANQVIIGDYTISSEAKVYKCVSNDENEKFIIFKKVAGKAITESILKQLLEKGRTTKKLKGFISSKNNKFDAFLVLKEGKVSFDFGNKETNY